MGMAEIAEVLWRRHLRHNPANPKWADRDRFVQSNGHGSMLIYALLHLTGYDLSIDDLKNFRQLHSKTRATREVGYTPASRPPPAPGPGHHQRRGHGAGRKILAAEFNRPRPRSSTTTYVFPGRRLPDGRRLPRGLLLAGTWGLGKLIAFYDDNNISIDGHVEAGSRRHPKRFEAYGWHVMRDVQGPRPGRDRGRPEGRPAETGKPTLICCKTIIGAGAPTNRTATTSTAPRWCNAEIAARAYIGWNPRPLRDPRRRLTPPGTPRPRRRPKRLEHPLRRLRRPVPQPPPNSSAAMAGDLPADWAAHVDAVLAKVTERARPSPPARPARTHRSLRAQTARTPRRLGRPGRLQPDPVVRRQGRHLQDDRRQLRTTTACASSAWRPSPTASRCTAAWCPTTATFLMFSEYARNALRMAALMKVRQVFVFHPRLHRPGRRRPDPPAGQQTATCA